MNAPSGQAQTHFWNRFQAGLRRLVWQRGHIPVRKSTPAFLVGNGRSGTSMIVRQLAKSWQVKLYNEGDPEAFENWFLRDFAVIEKLTRRSAAPLTLFKPIKDTYRTHQLLNAFTAAKVLFAFRHYDDVVNSARKKFFDGEGHPRSPDGRPPRFEFPPAARWISDDFQEFSAAPPPEATRASLRRLWNPALNLESNIALHWLFLNRLFFDQGLDLHPRVRLIHYEKLVTLPTQEFRGILAFLNLTFDSRVLDGVFSTSVQRDQPPPLDPLVRENCEQVWRRLEEASDHGQT